MSLTQVKIDDISGVPSPAPSDVGKVLSVAAAGTFAWTPAATGELVVKLNGIATGADVSQGETLGSGAPVFAGKEDGKLRFRSIKSGTGIQVTASGTEITITNTGGGGGGTGASKFTELTDVPTDFIGANGKALIVNPTENGVALGPVLGTAAALDVEDVASADHVHSAATGASAGFMSAADKSKLDSVAANADVTQAANTGDGVAVYAGKTGGVLQLRSISGTGPITVSEADGKIIINSSAGGGVTQFTQLSDVPTSYSGQANRVVLVNPSSSGLTFGGILGTAAFVNTTAFAGSVHGHAIGDITNLQATLDGKAAYFHGHVIADITGLQAALDGKVGPTHNHTASQISDSTTVGRNVLTAVDAAAARTAIGAFAATGGTISGAVVLGGNVTMSIAGGAVKGSVSSGTVTFNLADGNRQTITVAGAQTWQLTGWPTSGVYGMIEIFATNAGAAALTLPTIQWAKGDGTYSTSFASMGVTLQASGLNHFILWTTNGGSTIYGRAF